MLSYCSLAACCATELRLHDSLLVWGPSSAEWAPRHVLQEVLPQVAPSLAHPSSAMRVSTLRLLCCFQQPWLPAPAAAETKGEQQAGDQPAPVQSSLFPTFLQIESQVQPPGFCAACMMGCGLCPCKALCPAEQHLQQTLLGLSRCQDVAAIQPWFSLHKEPLCKP